jgi:hypothetical protein
MLVSSPTVFAWSDADHALLEQKTDKYNQNVDRVPGIIKFLFGNEKILLELTACSSNCIIGIQTSDGRIVSLSNGPIPSPTIKATMKESTLRGLLNSHDAKNDFANALKSGEIDFEGVGIIKKIKIGLLKQILKFVL